MQADRRGRHAVTVAARLVLDDAPVSCHQAASAAATALADAVGVLMLDSHKRLVAPAKEHRVRQQPVLQDQAVVLWQQAVA